jgi:hypothetical protein
LAEADCFGWFEMTLMRAMPLALNQMLTRWLLAKKRRAQANEAAPLALQLPSS